MFVSRQLKEDNIAEYLLYMWQIEDLIRANNLDIERINSTLVEPVNLTNEQKKELLGWYEELIEMIRREDVIKSGHLQINKNVISTLTDLHLTLLRSTKFPYYNAVYYKTLPYIVELRSKGNNHELSELENCFEVLYGILILQRQIIRPSFVHLCQSAVEFELGKVEGSEIIAGLLCPADQLEGAVLLQKHLGRAELTVIVISHGEAMGSGIMDHQNITHIDLRQAALDGEFVVILA